VIWPDAGAILIENGSCVRSGEPQSVVQHYLNRSAEESTALSPGVFDLTSRKNNYAKRELIIRKLELLDSKMRPRSSFAMGEKIFMRVHVDGMSANRGATIGMIVKDSHDRWLCDINTPMSCSGVKEPRSWSEVATLELNRLPFVPGNYPLAISVSSDSRGGGRLDYVDHAAVLEVSDSDIYGNGSSMSRSKGVLYLDGRWNIEDANNDESLDV
jgi:hypothetical protein